MPARRLIRRAETHWRDLPLLRIGEVSELLGVDRRSVEALVESGALRVRELGRIRLVETSSLEAWLDGVPVEIQGAPRVTTATRAAHRDLMRKLAG